MGYRLFAAATLAAGLLLTSGLAAEAESESKQKLQELGEFVGQWNANGEAKVGGRNTLWKETLNWGWKFKGDDAWLVLESKNGKHLTRGELRYDPAKKVYRLTATDASKKEQVYEGTITKGALVLTRKDPATGDVHKLSMHTLADGARMIVQSEVQSKGKGLFSTAYKIAATKEGESFAAGGKKNECVVTGGLGTMAVSFQGKTYYVCCSGCREEFEANPKKYVDEFEKKKKK